MKHKKLLEDNIIIGRVYIHMEIISWIKNFKNQKIGNSKFMSGFLRKYPLFSNPQAE